MMTRNEAFQFACKKYRSLLDEGWDLGYGQMVDNKMDIYGYPPPYGVKKVHVATLIVKSSTEVEFLQEN